MLTVVNPSNGQILNQHPEYSKDHVEAILASAQESYLEWKTYPNKLRSKILADLARHLRFARETLGRLMTLEMGKPIKQSFSEIDKCAAACEYFAAHGASFLQTEKIPLPDLKARVCFEPLGLVFGIMPWNFPLWQIFRFAAAALAAGNGIVIKHAPNVTGVALALETLFRQAGFPEHLFRVLLISTDKVEAVIADKRIAAVTFTGSETTGQIVAAQAGRHLKKIVLELGGSDPFIVLKDASLPSVIKQAVEARLINNGQSCIAAKRFIIAQELHQPFIEGLTEALKKTVIGDPLLNHVELGPLARLDLLEKLEAQIQRSIDQGAKLMLGGSRLRQAGYFFPPTILTNIKNGMPAYEEELFGPVFSIFTFASEEEAIALANDTPYGLGASIWSSDVEKAEKLAGLLQAGNVFINQKVISDVHLPFGGVKRSGYGRELSHYGIKEFTNIKSVVRSDKSLN